MYQFGLISGCYLFSHFFVVNLTVRYSSPWLAALLSLASKNLTCPVESPQMTWSRALSKALRAAGVPSTFNKWRDLAAYRDQLQGQDGRDSAHPTKAPRSSVAYRPATPPTQRWRQRARGANNSHAPRLYPSSNPRAHHHSEVVGCLYGRPRFRQSQGRGRKLNRGWPRPRQSRGLHRPQPSSII